MSTRVVKEMGLRPDEFFHWLPGAAGGMPWRRVDGGAVLGVAGRAVTISLEPLPERRIANVTMPVTRVVLDFDGLDAEETAAFLMRFDRAYHRGGG